MNAVLKDCHERIFSADDGVEVIRHGLYIVRGDNMYVYDVVIAGCVWLLTPLSVP